MHRKLVPLQQEEQIQLSSTLLLGLHSQFGLSHVFLFFFFSPY